MSHGGPLTLAQKRMMAMRSETAANVPTAGLHNTPLLPAVYDHSSSASTTDEQFGDIEMQDISASASITASPPTNYSHSRPQPSFSAAAKPFVPPGVTNFTTVAMSAAINTPTKRLPPHRAMQAQPPNSSAATPIVKPEPPASPALTEQSAIASPARRAGPHSKLGPHARKMEAPTQPNTPSAVYDEIDVSGPQVKNDTWADVQGPQIKAEVAKREIAPVIHSVSTDQTAPIVEQSATLNSAASAAQVQPSVESNDITALNQVNRATRHLGRSQWLAMLDGMDDPEKGCELILALADHLRASVESIDSTAPEPNTVKEVLVEFRAGQCAPATVFPDMTVSEMIKECASLINVKESDIRIVLRISKGHGDQSQESEEL
ncbi:hypothetical protein KCU78_g6020, partial [Aureobasidium melanogenum]